VPLQATGQNDGWGLPATGRMTDGVIGKDNKVKNIKRILCGKFWGNIMRNIKQ
jgi:hypothetical protein